MPSMRTTVTLEPEAERLLRTAMGLRAGHDPAHLNRLDDDLEAQAFVARTARLAGGTGTR
ncbi:MAG: hypothetical protein H6983_22390 [Ectothiorhodospiraceae bacterium]|nr:hypothetical protein [Ectothiorhodospiraceae bacterium]